MFALVHVKNYQFNTYRKKKSVSSIVFWMVHFPVAILAYERRGWVTNYQGCQNLELKKNKSLDLFELGFY